MANEEPTFKREVTCRVCNNFTQTIEIPVKGYEAWKAGGYIQDELPELTADEREMLLSATCSKCWSEYFPDDADDDDEDE